MTALPPLSNDNLQELTGLADEALPAGAINAVVGVLGSTVSATPPLHVRAHLATVTTRRAPNARPGAAEHHGNPVLGYRAGVDSLGTVLGSFDAWESPAVNGFDAHGLVCHLAAVETWFAATLGAATFVAPENVDATDHLGMTGPLTRALRAQAPAVAVAAWLTSAEGVLAALATADLGTPAGFYEINGPLAAVVIARMFELWTHEEDLRRAAGLSLNPPPAASLALMTDLGVAALPHVLVRAGLADSRTIEITLTGRGAGHWVRALDGDEPGEPAAFLVCDATDLCRVIADRCDPLVLMARPTTVIEGDRDLVHRVLVGATHMAAD